MVICIQQSPAYIAMRYLNFSFLLLLLLSAIALRAQKALTEGFINYKVKLVSPDNRTFTGTYTFTFKGTQLRKDLQLSNGYRHVIILNSNTNIIYSLQNRNGRKYAVELAMDDVMKKQEKYTRFSITDEERRADSVAGCVAYKGIIRYRDGSSADLCYTREWYPTISVTYNRYPDAQFMPLIFSYKDEDGVVMYFDAEKIESSPVENANFRIPSDYTIISNAEYKQMQAR